MRNVISSIKNGWGKLGKSKQVVLAVSALVLVLVASGGVYLAARTGQPADSAAVASPSPTPAPTPTPISRPDPPDEFTGAYTGQSVQLEWQGMEGVTYALWRNGKPIAEKLTEPMYEDGGYARDNRYQLMARREGLVSDMITLQVSAGPAAPNNVKASFDVKTKLMRLSWGFDGEGATFSVTARNREDETVVLSTVNEITDHFYEIDAEYSTAYACNVIAVDGNGVESLPVEVTIETDPAPTPTPSPTPAPTPTPPPTCILIMEIQNGSAEMGSVYPDAYMHSCTQGEVVSISATPEEGYLFDHWELWGDGAVGSTVSEDTTVTLSGDCTVTAYFTIDNFTTYLLTVDVIPWGCGDVWADEGFHHYGDEISLSAMPEEGYEFNQWQGLPWGVNSYSENVSFAMPAESLNITAIFSRSSW